MALPERSHVGRPGPGPENQFFVPQRVATGGRQWGQVPPEALHCAAILDQSIAVAAVHFDDQWIVLAATWEHDDATLTAGIADQPP
jgi:hypothetical protein